MENEPPAGNVCDVCITSDYCVVGRLRRRKRNLPPSIFDPFRDISSGRIVVFVLPGFIEHLPEMHTSDKKRATLSELFKPPLDLMFQGNFTEAKEAGTTVNKWLLVNIQDSREFSSQVLNRDVWNNSRVKSVVSNNFLLWQVNCYNCVEVL